MNRRIVGIAVMLLIVAVLPLAVIGDEGPRYGGQITVSMGHHTPDIDLAFVPSHINNGGWPVFNVLMEWNADSSGFVPALAESWEVSDDATTFTLKIRDAVKWHDGQLFTIDDVVWSWTIQLHPDVPAELVVPGAIAKIVGLQDYQDGITESIVGISVKPGNKVEFKLSAPDVTFLSALAQLRIFPRHLLMHLAPIDLLRSDFWQNPIGTGAFKFSKAVPGEYMEFIRNDDYFRGKPYLDKIIIRPLVDEATRTLRVEKGETDVIEIPPGQIEYLQSLPSIDVVIIPTPGTRGIEWVFKKPDIGDVRVRTAIMKALDVPTLVNTIIGMGGTPTELICATGFQLPENRYEPWGYDPEGAKALLEQARQDGVWTDRPIEIQTYYRADVYRTLLEAMQSYLAAVGITIKPAVVDDPTHMNGFYLDFTTDAALTMAWSGPDPSIMSDMLASANLYPDGWNGSFSNPQIDALFAQGAITRDPDERMEIYYQIQELAHETVALGAMWHVNFAYTVPKRCHNVIIGNAVPKPQYKQVELWWVDE